MADEHFVPHVPRPARLVRPVPVDPTGRTGPTRGAARGPRWRRVGAAGYLPADVELTVEQRIAEEWCNLPDSRVTGWAACRLWGAAYADGVADHESGALLPVPLWLPRDRSARPAPGRVVSRRTLPVGWHATRWQIATVTPQAAIAETVAGVLDRREQVVWLDMLLAAGIALPTWIETVLEEMPRSRAMPVRRALARASERSMSPNETRLRLVWTDDAGLGDPLVNQDVFDAAGRFLGRVDLLDPVLGLAGEYDGAAHRSADRHRRDVAREADLRDVGLEVVRIVGGELTIGAGRAEAAHRLRQGAARAQRRTTAPGWRLEGRRRPWRTACDVLRARSERTGS